MKLSRVELENLNAPHDGYIIRAEMMIDNRLTNREWHKVVAWEWKTSGIVKLELVTGTIIMLQTENIITFSSEPYEFLD